MRLLARDTDSKLILTPDLHDKTKIPLYAILSHTWETGQEVTFEDVQNHTAAGRQKSGFQKIEFCLAQAERDGIQHVWIDTCCICKADHSELQTALNSMFRWYRDAVVCYVYLSDVSVEDGESQSEWEPAFRASRWFTRGWTLQELLAPSKVLFYSQEGTFLGDKGTLERQIHEVTGIALPALRGDLLSTFSVDERLSWIQGRQTTREEDKAYALFGLFGVLMSLRYGEGEEEAFKRLRKKIEK